MAPHFATYLNDHLAGSVGALDLLEHLEDAHAGTPLEKLLSHLRTEIAGERMELEALIERLGASKSGVRQAVAWVSEKFAWLKLRVDDPADGPLRLLESVEALAIGVHGKGSLWKALAAASVHAPALKGPDYDRLVGQSQDQRQRLEAVRIDAACALFRDDPSTTPPG